MPYLFHFHRDTAPAGEKLEYVVLSDSPDHEEYAQDDFEHEVFEVDDFADTWAGSLPLDRPLVPERGF